MLCTLTLWVPRVDVAQRIRCQEPRERRPHGYMELREDDGFASSKPHHLVVKLSADRSMRFARQTESSSVAAA